MKRITRRSETLHYVAQRDEIAVGPYDLRESWLAATGARVIAQEAAARMDPEQITRLVAAAGSAQVSGFVAIANDDHFVDPREMVFAVEATVTDLALCGSEFFGLNLLLMAFDERIALLATVDDYSILAGPSSFVRSYQPDADEALEEFAAFVREQDPELQPAAQRALHTFRQYGPLK